MAGAALDVFEKEPLDPDSAISLMPAVANAPGAKRDLSGLWVIPIRPE